ncbi:MAG: transketolase C-terminal domain-containing protein [Parcubacteria group bacterium]
MKMCIEGSNAIARAIQLCKPAVVSAYPITPQTHIVEDLSQFKSDGQADFEFIRSESEFAAASIVLGASASGVRTYTASSSQGLLLMTEVLFTIAGMRLPIVMTCANRAVSAPINIWNDQQDSMTVRDSGWVMLYAEDNQEAVDFHFLAYKLAEQLKIPVMVNVDGFILTHTVESVDIPTLDEVKKFLPDYVPSVGEHLDPLNPISLGCFVTPEHYMEIRQELFDDLTDSKKLIKKELSNFKKIFGRGTDELVEYYGDKNADTVFVAMGSVVGTLKDAVDELNDAGKIAAVVKIKCFRPFPAEELLKNLKNAKRVAVIDKSISLGAEGILASEVKSAVFGKYDGKVQSFIVGLGGKDITKAMIKDIYKKVGRWGGGVEFVSR